MTGEELAALAVALEVVTPKPELEPAQPTVSRWKIASRRPDLGMEDLRALH